MARTSQQSKRPRRIGIHNPASKVRQVRCVARTPRERTRTKGALARKVPSITISGAWLRSAGFAIGKPCLVRAFAYGQLVICRRD